MLWESLVLLAVLVAIPLSLRLPLQWSLLLLIVIAFVAFLGLRQYNDDGDNPWYVGASFVLLPAAVLTAVVVLAVAAWRAAKRRG